MQQSGHLIIVPCHAAFRFSITQVPEHPEKDAYWVLQPFQQGEPLYYLEHIKKGVALLAQNPGSLLLFSGGRTRREAGTWSEAATYAAITRFLYFWTDSKEVEIAKLEARTDTETYARDSFENLLFSLYRHYKLVGTYPRHMTIVGWKFKQERFDFHRQTLGIQAQQFSYVGVNNPKDLMSALKGEEQTLQQFYKDPWGEQTALHNKRLARNPFHQQSPYRDCPPIRLHYKQT